MTRLSVDVDPELYEQLRDAASSRGLSIEDYAIGVLEARIRDNTSPYLTAQSAPLLAELWDNEEDAAYDHLS